MLVNIVRGIIITRKQNCYEVVGNKKKRATQFAVQTDGEKCHWKQTARENRSVGVWKALNGVKKWYKILNFHLSSTNDFKDSYSRIFF